MKYRKHESLTRTIYLKTMNENLSNYVTVISKRCSMKRSLSINLISS